MGIPTTPGGMPTWYLLTVLLHYLITINIYFYNDSIDLHRNTHA